ncbi:MAG: hypothetical protein VX966_01975 [Chloroflexota bacterium]|nr:hypothetical protein [Chloroflexota bacterium]
MARRPKRIDLEAVTDSTHPQHKRHRESLVMDLLRKHPRGPECKFVREDYHDDWSGHPHLHEGDEERSERDAQCGYDDLTIYRLCVALGVDGSEWDWKYKMRNMFPETGKNGHTRRSRRLAHRTERAYRRIMKAGRPGIYEVVFGRGYGGVPKNLRVFAESSEMAEMVAQASVGAAFPGTEASEIYTSFEREGCPSELMGINHEVVAKLKRLCEQKTKQIEDLKKEIELLDFRSSMIQTYSIAAVAG